MKSLKFAQNDICVIMVIFKSKRHRVYYFRYDLSQNFDSKFDALLKIQNNRATQKCDIIREELNSLFKIPGQTRWNGRYDSVADFNTKVKNLGADKINKLMMRLQLKRFTQEDFKFAVEYEHVFKIAEIYISH